MARISYETLQEIDSEKNNSENSVSFFTLKDDGDEAIVRIMHDSLKDFDIILTHQIEVNGNYRKISCLRDPRDDIQKCPLCASNEKLQQRMFIHMLQYTAGPDGKVVVSPVIWERSASQYAPKLKNYLEEYGPLSNCVFKIRRNGERGSMNTTYELLPASPSKYNEKNCPIIHDAFKDYSVLGTVVFVKNAQEINYFLQTGDFPKEENVDKKDKRDFSSTPSVAVDDEEDDLPFELPPEKPNHIKEEKPFFPAATERPTRRSY